MKKLKLLPSVLMLVLCIAVLGLGVYAATPATNVITGQITVNAANAEVEITGYIDLYTKAYDTTSTRTGINWNIANDYLTFDLSKAESLDQVSEKYIRLHIKNNSKKAIGAYFFKEGTILTNDLATYDNVELTHLITDSTGSAFAKSWLSSYTYIAPSTVEDGTNEVDMFVRIEMLSLIEESTSGSLNLTLNIEQYTTEINQSNYSSATGLIKLPETQMSVEDFDRETDKIVVAPNVEFCDYALYDNETIIGLHFTKNCAFWLYSTNLPALEGLLFIPDSAYDFYKDFTHNCEGGVFHPDVQFRTIRSAAGGAISTYNGSNDFLFNFIPENVTSITLGDGNGGECLFDSNRLIIPANVKEINAGSVDNIEYKLDELIFLGLETFNCTLNGTFNKILLNNGLTVINGAFKGKVGELIIPSSVNSIADGAFSELNFNKLVLSDSFTEVDADWFVCQEYYGDDRIVAFNELIIPSSYTNLSGLSGIFSDNSVVFSTTEKYKITVLSGTTTIDSYTLPTKIDRYDDTYYLLEWTLSSGEVVSQITDRNEDTTYFVSFKFYN